MPKLNRSVSSGQNTDLYTFQCGGLCSPISDTKIEDSELPVIVADIIIVY